MEILRDILLGIVQGVTGYLPVSSQGHIFLLGNIFGMELNYTKLLLCMLKLSGVLSLMIFFFKDIMKLIIGAFQIIQDLFSNIAIFVKHRLGKDSEGYYVLDTNPFKRQALMLVYSCITSGVVALLIQSIADNACMMPVFIGITCVVSGIVLFFAERLRRGQRPLEKMTTMDAVMIGIAQGLSIMPGLSRMVFCYAMAMSLGFKRSQAFRYACLLSIPTVVGYGMVSIKAISGTAVALTNIGNIIVAMVFCAVLTFIVLRMMMGLVKRGTTVGFAIYNVLIGVFTALVGIIF